MSIDRLIEGLRLLKRYALIWIVVVALCIAFFYTASSAIYSALISFTSVTSYTYNPTTSTGYVKFIQDMLYNVIRSVSQYVFLIVVLILIILILIIIAVFKYLIPSFNRFRQYDPLKYSTPYSLLKYGIIFGIVFSILAVVIPILSIYIISTLRLPTIVMFVSYEVVITEILLIVFEVASFFISWIGYLIGLAKLKDDTREVLFIVVVVLSIVEFILLWFMPYIWEVALIESVLSIVEPILLFIACSSALSKFTYHT